MHRYSVALLLALMISSPAQAQLWDYIVTSESGNRYYIDPYRFSAKDQL